LVRFEGFGRSRFVGEAEEEEEVRQKERSETIAKK
jgi:hypothetical protein